MSPPGTQRGRESQAMGPGHRRMLLQPHRLAEMGRTDGQRGRAAPPQRGSRVLLGPGPSVPRLVPAALPLPSEPFWAGPSYGNQGANQETARLPASPTGEFPLGTLGQADRGFPLPPPPPAVSPGDPSLLRGNPPALSPGISPLTSSQHTPCLRESLLLWGKSGSGFSSLPSPGADRPGAFLPRPQGRPESLWGGTGGVRTWGRGLAAAPHAAPLLLPVQPAALGPPLSPAPGAAAAPGRFEPRRRPAGRRPAGQCVRLSRLLPPGSGRDGGSAARCRDPLLCSSHGGLEQNRAGYCLIKAELLIAQTTRKAQFLLEDLGPYRDRFFPLHKKKKCLFPKK